MIRVLQVVSQMNRAGLESRLIDIYRKIDRSVVQFDFYTCRREEGYFDAEIKALGGRVYYNASLHIQGILGIMSRFKRFFSSHPEYQIVHCHLNQWCGVVLAGAKKAGVPVRIAHARTSLETRSLKNLAKNIIKIPVNYTATHRFAVSDKAGQWLFGKRTQQQPPVVIWPNAIDTERFRFSQVARDTIRRKLGLRNELTLIHVGNLRPEKNHAFLLRVFQELVRSVPQAKLLIVGQDYLGGQVQQQAQELGLEDGVRFLGARSDIPDLLCAADVFVFPSFYEGFPGAVLEAQASGLPCVVSDRVTVQVRLLSTTKYLSLNEPVEEWAKLCLQTAQNVKRAAAAAVVLNRGFDVQALSAGMMQFYCAVIADQCV